MVARETRTSTETGSHKPRADQQQGNTWYQTEFESVSIVIQEEDGRGEHRR